MKRDVLERPFETHLVKSRRGHSGRTFSYVGGAEYIKRLNEAFDGEWSFEVVEHFIRRKNVVVVGRLAAGGCTKMAFGGATVTVRQRTGEPLGLADDLKAAATDALKKAASLFGVGLDLHGADADRVVELKRPERKAGEEALTERQHNAILTIARTLGWTSEAIDERSTERYGVPTKELSKTDASDFIDELRGAAKSAA